MPPTQPTNPTSARDAGAERMTIEEASSRTDSPREALAVKRAEGGRLGRRPEIPAAVENIIRTARERGATLREIAESLNDEGVPAARGGTWQPATIARVLARTS